MPLTISFGFDEQSGVPSCRFARTIYIEWTIDIGTATAARRNQAVGARGVCKRRNSADDLVGSDEFPRGWRWTAISRAIWSNPNSSCHGLVEAGRVELPSKTVGPSINHERLPSTFSRRRPLSGPPRRTSSSIYLVKVATNRSFPNDPDFIRPCALPTGSRVKDHAVN